MSSSGEVTTERTGRSWSPMSATDLAHADDDDDDDGDDVWIHLYTTSCAPVQ